jgi:hypothetical protein
MNQEQEEKVVQFVKNTVPIFKYDNLKIKKLKKFDNEQLSQELVDQLRECLMDAIEYQSKTKEVK